MSTRPRIGILQARHAREFAALFERAGMEPVLAPCMREVREPGDEQLRERLAELSAHPPRIVIFQTGVGTQALFDLAGDDAGRRLREIAHQAVVVARGPKPLAVLHRLGIRVDRRTATPHTTRQVIELLQEEDLDGRSVAVQHYGSRNTELVEHLRGRGARAVELFSYRWALPDDLGPVLRLLDELRARRVDVTAFTSASQVENLFTVAADAGLGEQLPRWLNERTLTAAIGPTSAAALEQRGVGVAIQPGAPKMAPFVSAIGDHLRARSAVDGGE
jgi:uroporphyrinogen-III synthase